MTEWLVDDGVQTDPYDRTDIVLEGEGAERAAQILRRRGKASQETVREDLPRREQAGSSPCQ